MILLLLLIVLTTSQPLPTEIPKNVTVPDELPETLEGIVKNYTNGSHDYRDFNYTFPNYTFTIPTWTKPTNPFKNLSNPFDDYDTPTAEDFRPKWLTPLAIILLIVSCGLCLIISGVVSVWCCLRERKMAKREQRRRRLRST